nr:redox-sensing transcriptional repressor Rex [Gordonia soli]
MRGRDSDADGSPSDISEPAPIPEPTVARLAAYLHVLRRFSERGVLIASSVQLATAANVNSAILRKDLSHVGANGVRGVGYDVSRLTARIKMALHTDSTHTVALAGAGRLGLALLAHTGFGRGFRVAALFDADEGLVGTALEEDGPTIRPLSAIEAVCGDPEGPRIEIGVIATADEHAQAACDAFVAVGVRQVLNITPVSLSADTDVAVRQVDLALELQVLAFNASRSPQGPARNDGSTRGHDGSPTGGVPAQKDETVMGEETVTA